MIGLKTRLANNLNLLVPLMFFFLFSPLMVGGGAEDDGNGPN